MGKVGCGECRRVSKRSRDRRPQTSMPKYHRSLADRRKYWLKPRQKATDVTLVIKIRGRTRSVSGNHRRKSFGVVEAPTEMPTPHLWFAWAHRLRRSKPTSYSCHVIRNARPDHGHRRNDQGNKQQWRISVGDIAVIKHDAGHLSGHKPSSRHAVTVDKPALRADGARRHHDTARQWLSVGSRSMGTPWRVWPKRISQNVIFA